MAQTTEMYCLKVLEVGSPGLRFQQGQFLLRAVRKGSILGLAPWHVDNLLPVSSHHRSSLYVYNCVQISSLYKDPSHIRLGPILMTSFNLGYIFKDLISKKSHILKYQFRLQNMNFGDIS